MSKKVMTVMAGVLVIVSLLAMMTGCNKSLTLKVLAPMDGATLTTSPITVRGNVSDAKAKVQVNDIVVPVDKQGTFSTTIDPYEGKNTIKFVATVDDKETFTKTIIVTYTPPNK